MSTTPRALFMQVFKITVSLKAPSHAGFSWQSHNRSISPHFSLVWPSGEDSVVTSNRRAALAFQSPHWPWVSTLSKKMGQIILRGMQWESEKLCKQGAAYMLRVLNKKCRALGCTLGLQPLTIAKLFGQWVFFNWVSQDRCSFRNSRKLRLGPRGQLKGPIHSHSTQQHSRPPVAASVTEGRWDLPTCEGEIGPRANPRKKGELEVWDSPSSTDPLPSWNKTQGVFRGFLVLAREKQPAVGSLQAPKPWSFRKPNFSPGPWGKLLATRREANVRVRNNIPLTKLKTWAVRNGAT